MEKDRGIRDLKWIRDELNHMNTDDLCRHVTFYDLKNLVGILWDVVYVMERSKIEALKKELES